MLHLERPGISSSKISQILLFSGAGVDGVYSQTSLIRSLTWLAEEEDIPPVEIERQELKDLIELALSSRGFFRQLIQISSYPNPLQDPGDNAILANHFVDLFNSTLEDVSKMISKELLCTPQETRKFTFGRGRVQVGAQPTFTGNPRGTRSIISKISLPKFSIPLSSSDGSQQR